MIALVHSNPTSFTQQLMDGSNRRNELTAIAIYCACIALLLLASQSVHADDLDLADDHVSQICEVASPKSPTSVNSIASTTSLTANQSELYEISTRHLPDQFRSICFDQPNVEVNKWVGNGWSRSAIDEALPSEATGVLTIIYVHGNFMERNNALERARIVDRYLQSQTDRPYRLIMLSWPSQREKKPLRDVLDNAESAECQSLYVAWMLQRLRHEPQVSLLGFSFGARAVTGGLHLAAGGNLPGYMQPPVSNDSTVSRYRLGLVAPAIDRNWIESNGRHRLAMTNVESLINLYNSKDPVLRRFRFIDRLSRPIAAGFSGFAGLGVQFDPRATTPLAGQSRIKQYDCGSVIGTTHSERSYYGECPYFRMLIDQLLWKNSGETICNAPIAP
jgi:hypothetical protein